MERVQQKRPNRTRNGHCTQLPSVWMCCVMLSSSEAPLHSGHFPGPVDLVHQLVLGRREKVQLCQRKAEGLRDGSEPVSGRVGAAVFDVAQARDADAGSMGEFILRQSQCFAKRRDVVADLKDASVSPGKQGPSADLREDGVILPGEDAQDPGSTLSALETWMIVSTVGLLNLRSMDWRQWTLRFERNASSSWVRPCAFLSRTMFFPSS